MTDSAATTHSGPRWNIILLQLVFIYLLAIKLWFDLSVPPMGDEAYYWMWGQHLSWSYFDHPPLDGWLQGVVAAIFGWSNFSVRLLTWISLGGTLWIFWLWSEKLSPDDRSGWFWHTAVIYLTIPVIFLMSTFAFHDHLLIFLVVASAYFFHGFAADRECGSGGWRKLYLAAALLGLAVLTKYNGVFLGLAYAVWIIARPKLRGLILTPQLWLAGLLAVAIQTPVFYWNLTESLASFRFHLADRPTVNWSKPRVGQIVDYLATMAILMSPVLFLSLFRLPFLKPRSPEDSRAIGLSSVVYLTSTLLWAGIAAYVYVFFHWNIVAYAGLAPIAYCLLGKYVAWIHIALGLVLITPATMSYTLTPMNLLGYRDIGAAASYGWAELAVRVKAQQDVHPDAFVAASRYNFAAQLGFQLHDSGVAAFNSQHSQNDYWWNAAAHAGRDAIIVADGGQGSKIGEASPRFQSMEKLEDVAVTDRFGARIWTFEIWLGKAYTPATP